MEEIAFNKFRLNPIMGKRKILFIQHTLAGGGAEKVLIDILNRFDYNKYEVTLLLVSKEGVYIDAVPSEVRICAIKGPGIERLRSLPKFKIINNRWTRSFWRIADIWRALGGIHLYETVISFMEGSAVFYHTLLWPKGKRNVSWVHIDLLANHYTSYYFDYPEDEMEAYKHMNEIVFVSNSAQKAFEKLFNNKFPSRIVYNIIERNKIIERSFTPCTYVKTHKFTICSIGRLTPQKRQDRLINVIALLIKKYGLDVELVLLGDGELRSELMNLSHIAGISDYVSFMGFCNNPYPYLKASDAFLLTSDAEGFSLVVAEALCLGVPVVSTNTTGPNELLANDAGIITGFEEEEIAQKVFDLLTDPDKLNYYKHQAIDRSRIFDPDQTMNEVYRVINGEDK